MEWFINYVLGPSEPSKEVYDYVKRQCFEIYNSIGNVKDKRSIIKVYERMYPGLIKKVISENIDYFINEPLIR